MPMPMPETRRFEYINESLPYVPAVARRYIGCGLDPDEPGSPGDLGCETYTTC